MAKKKNKNVKNKKIIMENILPQNIIPMGEHVEENKNIYIHQSVYKEIHEFTRDKTSNESGGMLIGNVVEALGKTNIIIQGFVEAKYCDATPTTLKFTHETWKYVHKEVEQKYENGKIVGWIHTHPDFGIFLSEYDKFIQENFFKEEYQIAYVVDPIQDIEGFYFWINERIEKCKGFYIFDKTGENIDISKKSEKKVKSNDADSSKVPLYAVIGILSVITAVSLVMNLNLNNRVKILENKQERVIDEITQNNMFIQQQMFSIGNSISEVSNRVNEVSSKVYEEHPTEAETEAEAETSTEEINDNSQEVIEEEGSVNLESETEQVTTSDGETTEVTENE